MITVPANWAFMGFILWVSFFSFLTWLSHPKHRHQMNRMGFWGGVGGVGISQLYRPSFWNPPSLFGYTDGPVYLTIEDFLFGWAFMVIVTMLVIMTGKSLEKDYLNSAFRAQKLATLFVVVVTSGLAHVVFDWNWVLATSVGFLFGVLVAYRWNEDQLLRSALLGGLATMAVYSVLLGTYLMALANRVALAERISPFSVQHGVLETGSLLLFWAFAFGTFFSSLYPFMTGQRYADH